MNRKHLMIAIGTGALAVVAWLTLCPAGITARNALRLRRGMTEAQVEALLGEKGTLLDTYQDSCTKQWKQGEITITVMFLKDTGLMFEGGLRKRDSEREIQYPLTEGGNGERLDFATKWCLWIGFWP
jgi:hypothetical protein